MKIRLQAILMVLTILGISGFLFVWLKQTHEQEKKALLIKTDFAFRDVIQELQVSKLKFDSTFTDSTGAKKVRFIKGNFNEELTVNVKEKKGILSTINVISRKVNDSLLIKPGMKKGIFIAKDRNFYDSKIEGDNAHDHLIQLLYGVDSLQDSIKVSEIDTILQQRLREQNITVPFSIMKVDSTYKSGDPENVVMIGFAHPSSYFLKLGNTFPYMLRQMILPILFSVLLLSITIVSFWLLYRNLVQQKRLTAIKNEFIGNITHELKTPIATVSVAIEALKNFDALKDPQRTQDYLDISTNELQRLSLLVDKVLSLSKIEKKEIEIKKEQFDIVQLVREVMESLKLQFEKQHAVVSLQLTGTDFIIEADRRHISSVIFNLLDNALKYSSDGPKITIQLIDQSGYIEIRVSDHGIGIPTAYHKKIFEQFFRVPGGDTHNIKGYGLGLSYVYYIITSHQGSIEVESEPGKGSEFIIRLPFKEADVTNYQNNRPGSKK